MPAFTVIPRTGVRPRDGEQTFYCDPWEVSASSPQEAVTVALSRREAEWAKTGRSTGTYQFAVIGTSNRGFPGVTIVNATVEVASVRVSGVDTAIA